MPQQRRGLGKGLGALLPASDAEAGTAHPDPGSAGDGRESASTAATGTHYAEIPTSSVTPNPRQPRQGFDEEALAELATSIREVGLLQPIVVRALPQRGYELVMGERRWRAARQAEMPYIPAMVRTGTDTGTTGSVTGDGDTAMLRDALMENLHREQLNPLEEAAAYNQLLEDFGATHDELATKIGRSRPHITNTLRLLNLSPPVQRRVAAGVLSAGHARALLALKDPERQDRLAQRIVAEGLSVRAAEESAALPDSPPEQATDKPRSRPAPQEHDPALAELGHWLSEHFDTRVQVEAGKTKGKIVVEFASTDDLERIVAAMAPAATEALGGRGE